MKISQQFNVASLPSVVWDFFQDVPSVAQCLPGAELLEVNDDGTYDGKLSVKLGPMTAAVEGTATVTPDPDSMTAKIEGKGVDKRGGSRGPVTLDYRISAAEVGSLVEIDADVTLSGPAAQFGRTDLISEISKRLIGEFVDCLESKLAAGSVDEAQEIKAKEVKGISLFFSSLWAWFTNLFGGESDK
jgi:carbon monoxide dehydrogenase subunit G